MPDLATPFLTGFPRIIFGYHIDQKSYKAKTLSSKMVPAIQWFIGLMLLYEKKNVLASLCILNCFPINTVCTELTPEKPVCCGSNDTLYGLELSVSL